MNETTSTLDRPFNPAVDHVLGDLDAPVELVEYGDYECPHCRAAHQGITRTRERIGSHLRYVFRHLPNVRLHPNAELAAQAAEAAGAQGRFWEMHDAMMNGPAVLDRNTLLDIAGKLGLDIRRFASELDEGLHVPRVRSDQESAVRSGANGTPTLYVNRRRYDGAWDAQTLEETIRQPLGVRVARWSQDFAGLPASAGLMMVACAVIAMLWANSPWSASYHSFWEMPLSLSLGSDALSMTLREWINQGLMALFFFVVGLEVKREFQVGELSSRRQATLPIAAALGGLVFPALVYFLFNAGGPHAHGWGVPISTDTAFTLGLLALLRSRVPFALKAFVAALAVADDVGAMLVIAGFYTEHLDFVALAVAAGLLVFGLLLRRGRVYRPLPYALLGIALWLAVLYSGVHATLAGVVMALVIPTRSPPSTQGLLNQSIAAFKNLEAPLMDRALDAQQYQASVRSLEAVVERMLSPAQRLERDLQPWSSFLVLPLLALANAGVTLQGEAGSLLSPVALGIMLGLVVGKPLGIVLASLAAVRTGLADLPEDVDWRRLIGAAIFCGIGFTMAIFIASEAFHDEATLQLAKLSIILASLFAGVLGWSILFRVRREELN